MIVKLKLIVGLNMLLRNKRFRSETLNQRKKEKLLPCLDRGLRIRIFLVNLPQEGVEVYKKIINNQHLFNTQCLK